MSDNDAVPARLAGKRRAILDGALSVFARDGYSRTSIDAIAAAAGVSTRTIYNHFDDKAKLFESVIQESAGRVADAQLQLIERYLTKVTDIEQDLVDLGRALAEPIQGSAAHFALVRQVEADAGHIPEKALQTWHRTGPRRVRRALGDRLAELAEAGTLRVDAPELTAWHFLLLVSGPLPDQNKRVPSATVTAIVRSGVRTFLYGHAR